MTPAEKVLGLPLQDALAHLETLGIAPVRVEQSCAPRRTPDVGVLRVVRVAEGGRMLVVCGFLDEIRREE